MPVEMEKVIKNGQTDLNIMENGKTIVLVEKENLFMLTEIYMKVIGWMTKLTVTVSIFIPMKQNMKVNGKMISNMEWERNLGQMVQFMKDSMKKEKNMVKEYLNLEMDLNMKEISNIMIFMEKEYTNGLMVKSTMEIGTEIKCMVKEK